MPRKRAPRVGAVEATAASICSARIQPDKAASSESWDSCLLLMGVLSYLHREKLSTELRGRRGEAQVSGHRPSLPTAYGVCSGERTPHRTGTLQRLSSLNKADQLAGRGRLRNQLLSCLDFCQVCRNPVQQTAEVPHFCGNRCWKAESLCTAELFWDWRARICSRTFSLP